MGGLVEIICGVIDGSKLCSQPFFTSGLLYRNSPKTDYGLWVANFEI